MYLLTVVLFRYPKIPFQNKLPDNRYSDLSHNNNNSEINWLMGGLYLC